MKSWRLSVCVSILLAVSSASAATRPASDCSAAAVQAAVTQASDGDTVLVPAGDKTLCTWSTKLKIERAITLQGSGCALDAKGRPASCRTVIYHAAPTGLMEWTLVANQVSRVSGIEFRHAGGSGNVIAFFGQRGDVVPDSRRFRADHNRFVQVPGFNIAAHSSWGLIDHNYFDLVGIGLYFYNPSDYDYADARWAETPTDYGSNNFSFVEDNRVEVTTSKQHYPLTDAYTGAKFVVRFNDLSQASIQNHGTESSGRSRGGRAMEVYKNTISGNGIHSSVSVFLRSGTLLNWGNTWTSFGGAVVPAASLVYYRALGSNIFGTADGTNPWDVNDAANPQDPGAACPSKVCTATAKSTNNTNTQQQTVQVAGATWTTDQWRGYSIHKQNCVPADMLDRCGLLIVSNTQTALTYSYLNAGTHLDFVAGDQFIISKITHGFDAPCRGGGTKLVAKWTHAISHVGTVATVTLPGHGLTTKDYVAIWDDASTSAANPTSVYNGNYKVTGIVDSDRFTYTLGSVPSYNSTFASVTKLPGANDQVTEGCYQWSNTQDTSNLLFSSQPYPIRPNVDYFDYEPAKPFDGTIGANRSSVGVGVIAARPATCQTGTAYWATDEGEWDRTHSGPDGRLYICRTTNTWVLAYTPYPYPHPLAGSGVEASDAGVPRADAATAADAGPVARGDAGGAKATGCACSAGAHWSLRTAEPCGILLLGIAWLLRRSARRALRCQQAAGGTL